MSDGSADSQAALRRFAAQVAHEINNALTAVVGLADDLRFDAKLDEGVRQQIAMIAKQGHRLKRLADQLSAFSRGEEEFSLRVTAGEPSAAKSIKPPDAKPVKATAQATLLLVDDEETVRTIISSQLQAMGYRVLSVASADEALEAVGRKSATIDLALIDLILPSIDGIALARELRRHRAKLPVLLMTGDASAPAVEGFEPTLIKPIALDALKRAVELALT